MNWSGGLVLEAEYRVAQEVENSSRLFAGSRKVEMLDAKREWFVCIFCTLKPLLRYWL
jgi:hypothetical protein